MGSLLGARVLGEFGDASGRYADAKARKNYAGTRPRPQPQRCTAPRQPAHRHPARLPKTGTLHDESTA
jgi:hypothetical protein